MSANPFVGRRRRGGAAQRWPLGGPSRRVGSAGSRARSRAALGTGARPVGADRLVPRKLRDLQASWGISCGGAGGAIGARANPPCSTPWPGAPFR